MGRIKYNLGRNFALPLAATQWYENTAVAWSLKLGEGKK